MKKIAILTSGGDAPGMNKAIATLTQEANKLGWETYVVLEGYKGLYEDRIKIVNQRLVASSSNLAGSVILSSRFPEFKEDKIADICAKNLKDKGIDLLFVLGGNGTFTGAKRLISRGVNVIGIPCTIDNDVNHTEYTIGFVSALSACVDTIDMLKATCDTHGNVMFVEIMGRKCSDLTIATSFATNVDYIITPYNIKSPDEIVSIIKKIKAQPNQKGVIILITELIYTGKDGEQMHLNDLRKYVEEKVNTPTRTHVIGFVQRGAHPTAIERYNADRISRHAISLAKKNKLNVAIGIDGDRTIETDLNADFNRVENEKKVNEALTLINVIDNK